jgi:hypothetical protein
MDTFWVLVTCIPYVRMCAVIDSEQYQADSAGTVPMSSDLRSGTGRPYLDSRESFNHILP